MNCIFKCYFRFVPTALVALVGSIEIAICCPASVHLLDSSCNCCGLGYGSMAHANTIATAYCTYVCNLVSCLFFPLVLAIGENNWCLLRMQTIHLIPKCPRHISNRRMRVLRQETEGLIVFLVKII